MPINYFLVIDAGTGSGRVIIFDEKGNQIAIAQKEWKHLNLSNIPGAIDFNTKKNWDTIVDLIQESISKSNIDPKNIKAISSSSMREGIVFYDKDGEEIWACSNVDSRAETEVDILKENHKEIDIYNKTGQGFSLSDAPRLLWIKRNMPNIYEDISSLGMISDWITYKLSGIKTVEPSNASTSGFFNTFQRKWDSELIEEFDFPKEIYPKVIEPGTVIGKIKPNLSKKLGLSKKTLIVAGGGDAQLGTIGVGSVKDGDTVILGGTFWQQEVNIKNPKPHPKGKIRINAHIIDDLWNYEGISFQIGLVMRWFRDAFCHREKNMAKELGISTYSILGEMAKNIPPGSNGIMPYNSDIMNYMHWKHASPSLMNFDINRPKKTGKAATFRALMENAAFNSLGNLETITDMTGNYPEEIIFAGGASNSPVWSKIIADVLNVKIKVPKEKEATALGAFFCAAIGYGVFDNFKEAANKVSKIDAVYLPDKENNKIYKNKYNLWKKSYKDILSLSDKNILNYMWKAPGE